MSASHKTHFPDTPARCILLFTEREHPDRKTKGSKQMSLEVHNVALSVVHTDGPTPNRDRLLNALLDMILRNKDGQTTLMEALDRPDVVLADMVTFFFSTLSTDERVDLLKVLTEMSW